MSQTVALIIKHAVGREGLSLFPSSGHSLVAVRLVDKPISLWPEPGNKQSSFLEGSVSLRNGWDVPDYSPTYVSFQGDVHQEELTKRDA
jgi:hypothetical protein